MESRQTLDCRKYPTSSGCTLTISGRRDEVLLAGLAHARAVHGEHDTPQTRLELERALEPESALAAQPGRKVADCRLIPSEGGCTLTISGEEGEVLRAATDHAISVHRHEASPELMRGVRDSLVDESRYTSRAAEAAAP